MWRNNDHGPSDIWTYNGLIGREIKYAIYHLWHIHIVIYDTGREKHWTLLNKERSMGFSEHTHTKQCQLTDIAKDVTPNLDYFLYILLSDDQNTLRSSSASFESRTIALIYV